MSDAGSPQAPEGSQRGYLPTRDQMLAIERAASIVLETLDGWHACSAMPGFPVDSGAKVALRLIFNMERALNPARVPWADLARKRPEVRVWPDKVEIGLHWIREVFDLLMARAELESMATAASLEAWKDGHPEIPTKLSFRVDELGALREAIAWLASRQSTAEAGRSAPTAGDPAGHPAGGLEPAKQAHTGGPGMNNWDASCPPVVLFSPNVNPIVLGIRADKLTATQFRVVKALLDAWPESLSLADLHRVSNSGDAPKVLKRLIDNHEATWARVLMMPGGPGGKGYRLASTEDLQTPPDSDAETSPDIPTSLQTS